MSSVKDKLSFHSRLKSIIGNDVKEWADKIGVSDQAIRDGWLKGSYPRADKLIKLAELGVEIEWLLLGNATNHPPESMISEKAREMYPDFSKAEARLNELAEDGISDYAEVAKILIDDLQAEIKRFESKNPKKKKAFVSVGV